MVDDRAIVYNTPPNPHILPLVYNSPPSGGALYIRVLSDLVYNTPPDKLSVWGGIVHKSLEVNP